MRNPAALAALAGGDIENALVASTPGGIEAQEARGQTMLVQSSDMPLELRPSKEVWEAVGFTFGEKLDEVFQSATLPPGWTREASDHSMLSYIKDEQGRRRAAVFYKAAFYDRRASASLETRYSPMSKYPAHGSDALVEVGVSDCGVLIWKAGDEPKPYVSGARDALDKAAMDYLKEHFPNWADPTAY